MFFYTIYKYIYFTFYIRHFFFHYLYIANEDVYFPGEEKRLLVRPNDVALLFPFNNKRQIVSLTSPNQLDFREITGLVGGAYYREYRGKG